MEIAELWRYPVKSMQGEPMDQVSVGPGGIHGDRHWAVVDAESGVSLSAKRYPVLLHCQAWTRDADVVIRLPNGREHLAGSAAVAQDLSALLQRQVTTRSADATHKIRHEFPTVVTEGKGDPFLYEPKTEAFFDCAPLQLLTTATLSELQKLLPKSVIDRARFRPNFLLKTSERGFIENQWVNRNLTLGTLGCQVYDDTRRCIMVALEQGECPRDTGIIRTILKCNEGRAGVALKTSGTAVVHRGAPVALLS